MSASPGQIELTRSHLRWGWWSLLAFLLLGVVLEILHGWKVGAYLQVGREMRRLMWTLAHAHGTLLSLVHLAFAVSLPHLSGMRAGTSLRWASRLLMLGGLLVPIGFFLGGAYLHGGDPGLGILLVPVGALMLAVAIGMVARAAGRG